MTFYLEDERERESEPAPQRPTSDTPRAPLPDPADRRERSLPDPGHFVPLEGERPDFPRRTGGADE